MRPTATGQSAKTARLSSRQRRRRERWCKASLSATNSLYFVFLLQGVKGDGSSFTYPLTGRFQLVPTGTLYEESDATADGIRTQTFIGGFNLNAEVIPDASTVTLFASGLLPMVALLRRRKA
jgi:hypothetical protein